MQPEVCSDCYYILSILELISGKAKIQELIDSLDEKKNEQVLFTFKQMCKNFAEIFSDLVPNGKGELVLTGVEDEDGIYQFANATGIIRISSLLHGPRKDERFESFIRRTEVNCCVSLHFVYSAT